MKTRLSTNQNAILSAAAARPDGSLLPIPDSIALSGKALDRAVASLIRRGFAAELSVGEHTGSGSDAGVRMVVITPGGRAAIGLAKVDGDTTEPAPAEPPKIAPALPPAVLAGKLGVVLKAVSSDGGATLGELVAATSWLNHTTRAALTRLRQRGFDIRLENTDGRRVYRLHRAA